MGRSFRVATYNIHRGYGRDRRQDLDRVAAVLREMEGDVLALQEVDSDPDPSEEDLLDHLAHLATATGFHAVTGPTLRRRGMAYGNLLLSRYPVGEVVHLDLCVAGCEPRAAIDARLLVDGAGVRMIVTHLGLRPRERREQIARLVKQAAPRGEHLLVVAGDMNEWLPFSPSLRPLRRVLGPGTLHATFPARLPLLSLDKIFVSPARALRRSWVHRSPAAARASDHLPVVAELDLAQATVRREDLPLTWTA
ncbi:MAG TPA: endonuclease/exonuclease/phosphatase family protein [Candidatus Polarisedimenticolaceae bacterium]|nr:endonuclease/exonuclease/phosphatase family protein [Candidatus Polarisedimenticolaceae bacterium]